MFTAALNILFPHTFSTLKNEKLYGCQYKRSKRYEMISVINPLGYFRTVGWRVYCVAFRNTALSKVEPANSLGTSRDRSALDFTSCNVKTLPFPAPRQKFHFVLVIWLVIFLFRWHMRLPFGLVLKPTSFTSSLEVTTELKAQFHEQNKSIARFL